MSSRKGKVEVDICVLRASDSALPAVQRIDSICFHGGERTDIATEIERPFTWAWSARIRPFDGERAWVGYLLTWLVADELHVLNVATDPNFRRHGVGHALIERAIDFARESHVRLVLLEVRRSNVPALRLYRSFGFCVLSIRRGYYGDNGEDAIEMGLVLDPETGDIVPSRDEVRLEEV